MLIGRSFTTSINSTVTDYKFEHGRRYHAYQDGKYALPNDDAEINRLGKARLPSLCGGENVALSGDLQNSSTASGNSLCQAV